MHNISTQFAQVSVRVILHKGLMFRSADVGAGANTLDKDIGNVRTKNNTNCNSGHVPSS